MHNNKEAFNDNVKIVDYWNRRGPGLSNEEWLDFYRLLFPVLMRTRLPPEFNAVAKRKDLVQTFFYDKVYLNAGTSKAGPLQKVHAVHLYLKRFALDVLEAEGQADSENDEEATAQAQAPTEVGHARLLREAGIDIGAAMHSADQFLGTLASGERGCLRDNSCADPSRAEPISRIAERLNMGPDYHRKIKELGITRTKGATYAGYEKTKIGRWLCGLGACLQPDWREELAALLIVLCERVRVFQEKAP
ncbi:hypothetical protein ACI48D_20055 [Massilia sp. LXY-6]|uniref:hypothetical protein n=1 Tax=Massilia sp. LXY-6 TaxID=3379823 RepID=UPI003EE2DA2C